MRILLAEHHRQVLKALRMLIAEKTEHVIDGEAINWDSLLERARITGPDLVLLDWDLPGRAGHILFAELRTQDCHPRVLVLSTHTEVKEEALKAGADAFVSKGESPEKLLEALEAMEKIQAEASADEMLELD